MFYNRIAKLKAIWGGFALLVGLFASNVLGQSLDNKGDEFFLAYMPQFSGNTEVHLASDVATTVTVEYPVGTVVGTPSVTPGTVTVFSIPNGASSAWTDNSVQSNLVRVSSNVEFVAYMANIRSATSDAALALPVDTMNTEYIVIDYNPRFIGSEFVVYAAFDNTDVTITPSRDLVGRPAGVPFTVTLNRGQGYFARSSTQTGVGATGTIIEANRPVGLTNGNGCTQVPTGTTACDHIFEVAQPVQSWGTAIPVRNLPNRTSSFYRIVASEDGTTVTQDGAFVGTLNRGDFIETNLGGTHLFEGDKPIYVVQFMPGISFPGSTSGDPAMANMIPSAQYLTDYTFSTVGGGQFAQHFVTIIAENADQSTLLLDGVTVASLGAVWQAVPGTTLSSTIVSLVEGSHTTSSASPHGITVEGYNSADSYVYPGGALFQFINPKGDQNPPVCTLVSSDSTSASGGATDNRPSEDVNNNGVLDPGEDLNGNGLVDEDTGIFFVQLAPGSSNLVLNVSPFIPGDPSVSYNVSLAAGALSGSGTVVVTDGAGNTCEENFSFIANQPPLAACQNVVVGADPVTGLGVASASDVDNGSTDPDGDPITLSLVPAGPFTIGTHAVVLTVTDSHGVSSSCNATVTVQDITPPVLICPEDLVVECDGAGNGGQLAGWLAGVAATDNSGPVSVTSAVYTGSTSTISFADFSDLSSLQLNGATASIGNPVIEGGNAVLRLTDHLSQSGSAFSIDSISLASDASFSTRFSFQIDNNVGIEGADGITFVVQTVSNTAGGSGGGIGYLGLSNSVGIEFDTYNNGAIDGHNGSHIGIDINGDTNSVVRKNISPALDSGTVFHAWVDYDGATNQLEVRIATSNSRPAAPDLSHTVDLVTVLGQTQAFVGFTSGTGAGGSHHDILDWEFNNSFRPIGVDPCGNNVSIPYIFTATDPSGNTSSCIATFATEDTTPPAIGPAASDLAVECTGGAADHAALNAWLVGNGGAVASDICGAVSWSHNFVGLSDECGGTGAAIVTFVATDACGNSSSTTASFSITDTTPPSIADQASDLTVECDGAGNLNDLNSWLGNNGGATASDLCSGVTWSHSFAGLSDDCGATGSASVTFTATDDCGNSSETIATFTIEDTTPPAVVDAGDLTVECDGEGNSEDLNAWLDNNGGASASDDCSGVTWSHDFSGLSDGCGGTGSATVTFKATDACGNSSSSTATFTIEDTIPPAVVDALDEVVECDGAGNLADLTAWLESNGGATATDICGAVTWSHDFAGLSDDCGGTGSATVIFTATDACSNSSTTEATFTIIDTTDPVIDPFVTDIVPADAPISFTAVATDICGDASVVIVSVVPQAINGAGKLIDKSESTVWAVAGDTLTIIDGGGVGTFITVIAVATDSCGNTSELEQVIHVLHPQGGDQGGEGGNGNEGVGNGEDGNTPGHDNNGGNDDPGNGPGNPGAKGKKK